MSILFDSDSQKTETIHIDDALVSTYGLKSWSEGFSLMTAGYRDRLDPENADNPEISFNSVTVAVFVEAKARVFKKKTSANAMHVHVGGEVRPHTQHFIRIAARIYSHHGFTVHLRENPKTTPIWYSSFGVLFCEYGSGDNFTASHSQYYKGGWKPIDGEGKQLTIEEADIIEEVESIVSNRETITLDPWGSSNIVADFNVDEPYLGFLRSVLGSEPIQELEKAQASGFKTAICTLGGSMKSTTERLLSELGLRTGANEGLWYFMDEEDSQYHGVGETPDGNFGVDPSSPTTYKGIGAEEILRSGRANLVLIWDPDGDRVNYVSTAPQSEKTLAAEFGLQVGEDISDEEFLVYFTPNQSYLMLLAYRLNNLRDNGLLEQYDWFVGESYPTATFIEELAESMGLPCVRVPVGFKNIGDLCKAVESQIGKGEVTFESSIGDVTKLGENPRALILCEESGGATMGGTDLLKSVSGEHAVLALREKDAMMVGLMIIGLASKLYQSRQSFVSYYSQLIQDNGIRYVFYDRKDIRLYDEGLMGEDLRSAKEEGFKRRDALMGFFRKLADQRESSELGLDDVWKVISEQGHFESTDSVSLKRFCWAGDGILMEASEFRVMVRASGTDALLRFYVEAPRKDLLESVAQQLLKLSEHLN